MSMNLVDITRTPLSTAFEAVRMEAAARGAEVTWSEIIGLVPEQAMFETAAKHLQLREPIENHLLERRILAVRQGRTYIARVSCGGRGTPSQYRVVVA